MANKVTTKQTAEVEERRGERKTAIGLFRNAEPVDEVARKIEALGFPRNEVRILEEPERFEVSGTMSFPRLDFEVELREALTAIGATETEIEAYFQGLRRGGALVFATGSNGRADAAAEIMKRNGAVNVTKGRGPDPYLPYAVRGVKKNSRHEAPDIGGQVGRVAPSGSAYFSW